MMGKGVRVYCIVFTIVLIFAIFSIINPAYATIQTLKFDQSEIPIGHSDVISIISPSAPPLLSFENFEAGFTTWVNDSTLGIDDNDCWKRESGPPGTMNTGPTTGAPDSSPTAFYLHYESSIPGACAGADFHKSILLGPIINFDAFNSVQVQFSRHMWDGGAYKGDDMGRLALQIEDDLNPGTFIDVPNGFIEGDQGNQWVPVTVDLTQYDNTGQRRLAFLATDISEGVQSDMAIDEITVLGVYVGPPQTVIISEDFESGVFTDWDNDSTPGVDDNDCWDVHSGPSGTTNTGPTTGAPDATPTTFYAYYESSITSTGCEDSDAPPDHEAILLGPIIDFTRFNSVQVQFSRHMWDGGAYKGDDMGRLALQIEDDLNPGTFIDVPNGFIEGDQGNQWVPVTVDLTQYDNTGQRRLAFLATDISEGVQSDMAIDEITVLGVLDLPPTPAHVVTLQRLDPSGSNVLDSFPVILPERDSNTYWTMVEFGDITTPRDVLNQHMPVEINDIVRIIDADGNTDDATIITDVDQIPNAGDILTDNISVDCSTLPGAVGDNDVDKDAICDTWEDNIPNMEIDIPDTGFFGGKVYELNQQVCDSFIYDPKVGPVLCGGSDKRDIYVEIDYMEGHRPNEEALYQVIEAFANAPAGSAGGTGIRLHIQLDDSSRGVIDHRDCIYEQYHPGPLLDSFDEIRTKHYGTDFEHDVIPEIEGWEWGYMQKRQIFHYAMFVHGLCDQSIPPLPSTSSGVSEVFGNDLIVSLGAIMNGPANPDHQAGTFMHELGHNLKLHHGGEYTDITNCKPNHFSVMNYARQFPDLVPLRSLDYSRMVTGSPGHPTSLDESDLMESMPSIDTYLHDGEVQNLTFGPIPPFEGIPSDEHIDWNQRAPTPPPGEEHIQWDVNDISGLNCENGPGIDDLEGHNDWLAIDLLVRDSNYWADGRPLSAGFHTAVWENGATKYPLIPSLTCPSTKQVMDYVPTEIRKAAENSSAPGHDLAKQKMLEHFLNYRTCDGGSTISDPHTLKATYLKGILLGMPYIVDHYVKNPEQLKDPKIQQTVLNAIGAALEYNATGDVDKATEKLTGNFTVQMVSAFEQKFSDKIDTILEFKSTGDVAVVTGKLLESHNNFKDSLFSLEPLEKTEKDEVVVKEDPEKVKEPEVNVWEVETIYGQDGLGYQDVIAMRTLKLDSMLVYLNKLDPSDFKNNDPSVIQSYYVPILEDARTAILAGKMAEAAMNMTIIVHSDYIDDPEKLKVLESGTQDIIEQYSRAIPEFGTIAMLILVAAITSIIILTKKTRFSLIPKYYH